MHFGTLLLRNYALVVPKLGQARNTVAFSSAPHRLVPVLVGLVLHRRSFSHPNGLVVELQKQPLNPELLELGSEVSLIPSR
jgi:hypothetical protein